MIGMESVPRAVKGRRFTALCAVTFALGLILSLFMHPSTQSGLNALHVVVGAFEGMSGVFGALAVKLLLRRRP